MAFQKATVGLTKILNSLDDSDLGIVAFRIDPKKKISEVISRRELICTILSKAKSPSQVLRIKCLRKYYIERYLRKNGITLFDDQCKNEYIELCLKFWNYQEDATLRRFAMIITKKAEDGLRKVLDYAEMEDLRDIVYGLTSKATDGVPHRDLVNMIIANAKSPDQVLKFRCLIKSAIESYLKEVGERISEKQKKNDLIQKCLDMWNVEKEINVESFQTEQDITNEMDRLRRKREREIDQRNDDYEASQKRLKRDLEKDTEEITVQHEANMKRLEKQLKQLRQGGPCVPMIRIPGVVPSSPRSSSFIMQISH